ncbi:5,6-dimethylbenzimidazole synthase [Parasphingorhabdus cellanae]|uniref:5,6-dimethylbenzimidazole synthase n=1 Tax=Parasphingorhabdus cellanae TaxID=2806553 RepID=A0ABX7T8F8_9SPHN|nr:5,6-dimethylbenzimidazole synthase [Parasphingorhabdus cellanae]QTD56762.1 5,6-dimethylbenzimidazole synthase [Parasphingorhabdus cellanae]
MTDDNAHDDAPTFDDGFRDGLDQLLAWRRDVRRFSDRSISPEILDDLLNRACLAPSVGNAQPWRFVSVENTERRQAVIAHVDSENRKAAAAYADDNERSEYQKLKLHGLREAPVHLAVFCDMAVEEGRGLGRQTMPETLIYSVVMAIHNLWLTARARNIGLGWVSICEPDQITALLDVPAGWHFIGYLCIGYPAQESDEPELVTYGWQDRIDLKQTRFVR